MATIENEDPNQVAFSVKGAPGQLPALMDLQDSNGNSKFMVDKDGNYFSAPVQPFKYTTFYGSLQQAMEALPNGGSLYHPDVSLQVVGEVSVPHNLTLLGGNWEKSIFQWDPKTTDATNGLSLQPGYGEIDFTMRDIQLLGNVNKTGDALYSPRGTLLNLNHNIIRGFTGGRAVHINGADPIAGANFYCSFNNSLIENCLNGMRFEGDCRVWNIQSNSIHGITNTAIELLSTYNFNILQNTIEQCFAAIDNVGGPSNNLIGNYFEADSYCMSITNYANGGVVMGNWSYGCGYFIALDYARNILIQRNMSTGGNPLYAFTCSRDIGYVVATNNAGVTVDDHNCPWIFTDITAEPAYMEATEGGSDALPSGTVIRGGRAIRTKPNTGAPTDAAYGSTVGTVVYNSFDKVMYVHGPDGVNDWDVV